MGFWDIKVFTDKGEEKETIRHVTYSTKDAIESVFKREGIRAKAIEYNDDGTKKLDEYWILTDL